MKRNIYRDLINWKSKDNRKPLIILGQRQIGKTYIISQFGKSEYKKFIYINLFNNKMHQSIFENLNGFDDLFNRLTSLFSVDANEIDETLFFIDEIQESNNAISSLKLINESDKKINVICTGSYLGYNINSSYLNFPIGQVEIIYMKQMMFDEFMEAIGQKQILDIAVKSVREFKEIDDIYHKKLLTYFNHYLIIGGFPEVIKTFINDGYSYKNAMKNLELIYLGYLNDINKYSQLFKSKTFLNLIFTNINSFLVKENKKFIFSELDKSSKFRELEKYINWLDRSNLVVKINNLKNLSYPSINQVSLNHFKLYYNDHGFLSLNYGLENSINEEKFNAIKGGLYENFFVSQTLYCFKNVYYYSFIKNGKKFEVDFVVTNKNHEPCLIEIKSSSNFKTKSLKAAECKNKYILSPNNYEINENYINIPIYLSFAIDKLV